MGVVGGVTVTGLVTMGGVKMVVPSQPSSSGAVVVEFVVVARELAAVDESAVSRVQLAWFACFGMLCSLEGAAEPVL